MLSPPAARAPVAPRLLDKVRERVRYLHFSLRTEEAYVHSIRAFVRYHGRRHLREMGGPQVEAFLAWLSGDRGVSVSTHRHAQSARCTALRCRARAPAGGLRACRALTHTAGPR
jgi:hypothetical protein